MRVPLLIAVPTFFVGCLVTASVTSVAGAKGPAPVRSYDYQVAYDVDTLQKLGRKGYAIVGISGVGSGSMVWTLQRK